MVKEVVKAKAGMSWRKGEWIVGISAIVLIIASFLTWVKSSLVVEGLGYESAIKSLSGIGVQAGYITAAIGVIVIIMLFIKKSPKISAIVLGAISFLVAGIYWYYIKYVPKQFIEIQGEIGIGIYLTLLAGVGLVVGGIINKKK